MKSKAWKILNKDEKSAMMLKFNKKKSSWEAGEIMDKSHYKYLEISSRAKFFFTTFTDYFEKTGDLLIPENTEIPDDFREFLHNIIEKRMGYSDAISKLDPSSPLYAKDSKTKTRVLTDYLALLKDSGDELQLLLYDLIFDFDRWNNFRILPESLQEPSAFKRRNKTRLLKHLKNLNKIDEFNLYRFTKTLSAKNKKGKKYYLPLVSETFAENYNIVILDRKKDLLEYISKEFKLYIFKNKDLAKDYAILVDNYINLPNKNCKEGQIFWPTFRKLISKAINYNLVNNIIPRRKHLENSFREIDFNLRSSKKIKKNSLNL